MALLENGLKGLVPNMLIGVGIAIAAPILFPAAAAGLRPVAKTLIKGAVYVADSAKGLISEAGEQLSDLVAEVRAEGAAAGDGAKAGKS